MWRLACGMAQWRQQWCCCCLALGSAMAQLQGEPQALLKWHHSFLQVKLRAAPPKLSTRAILSCVATSPCDSCATCALSALQCQAWVPGQHHPRPSAAMLVLKLCSALQISHYLEWYFLSNCSMGTDPWPPLCSKETLLSQAALHLSQLKVTTLHSQSSPSSLTATNISRASHSQNQTAAPFSHRRCVFLACHCCDSFAKSISRGDLEQGHSYFLARYPSWSIHL